MSICFVSFLFVCAVLPPVLVPTNMGPVSPPMHPGGMDDQCEGLPENRVYLPNDPGPLPPPSSSAMFPGEALSLSFPPPPLSFSFSLSPFLSVFSRRPGKERTMAVQPHCLLGGQGLNLGGGPLVMSSRASLSGTCRAWLASVILPSTYC